MITCGKVLNKTCEDGNVPIALIDKYILRSKAELKFVKIFSSATLPKLESI
jgi:hypothetical protein